jgi:hypothetical protein
MLGRIASDALGTSDICAVIRPPEWPASPSAQYLFVDDGEAPVFVLRSKTDEYAFTGRALVHLDGHSAMSKKRLVKRYPWVSHSLSSVQVETAGTIDLDAEIKFTLTPAGPGGVGGGGFGGGGGAEVFSIDVAKKEMPSLILLYKSLAAIAEIQARGDRMFGFHVKALDIAAAALARGAAAAAAGAPPLNPGAALVDAATAAVGFLGAAHDAHRPSDFTPVFARYLSALPPPL